MEVNPMIKRLLMALLTIGLLAAMLPGAALAGHDNPYGDGPNQGRPDMVLKVEAQWGCCVPVASKKYEGDFGTYQKVWSYSPIDFVSVKSGKDAYVKWSSSWKEGSKYYVAFKLSKDISNFVIWTCPCVPS
jgi:hypothetical protein